jgi:aspartate/methionine/tyrosine aminotransferase
MAERNDQHLAETRFIDAFFRLHGQTGAARLGRTWLSYSASVSTMVVGMFLAQQGKSVSLVEPCFDNLPDLLRKLQVRVDPLPEHILHDAGTVYERLDALSTDAIYLVDPNNPTGFTTCSGSARGFAEIVRHCRDRGKILILDFCFAAFSACHPGTKRPDVYRMLEESGVSYLAIEDTGKTWPVQDAKCALLTVSADLQQQIWDLQTAVLLNVSPFVLHMLTAYIEDSIADQLFSVRSVVSKNRAILEEAIAGTELVLQQPLVDTSVAWLRLSRRSAPATLVQKRLRALGIYVLPGTYFYWSSPERGEDYLRIALARDPELFAEACRALSDALREGNVLLS